MIWLQDYDRDLKQSKGVSGIKHLRQPRMAKQKTVLHMGVFDMEMADKVRTVMHRYYFEAVDNQPRALISCFEALDQIYIIIKFAVSDNLRKKTDTRMKKTRDKIREFRSRINNNKQIKAPDYNILRDEVQERIEDIYLVKQIAGLGMPTEVIQDDETVLEDAVRS